jgi:zinc protease
MTEGTKSFSSFQIAEAIDFSGAYLDVNASHHNTIVSVFAVKHILVSLFPLIKSILTEPTFPDEELKVILANNKQEFIIGSKKVMSVARRIFPSMLYGENHPYGKILTECDFDNVTSGDLRVFFNTLPVKDCKVYLSGNIDTDVISSLGRLLAGFQNGGNVSAEDKHEIILSPEKEKVIVIPDAVQSAIVMGLPVVGRNHPDFPLLMLTNTIFGGYFGSRLMKTIREEKGFTYGISSGIVARPKASHLSVQTEVNAGVTSQALDEIFKEIFRLSAQNVSMDELNTARNYLFGNVLRSMDGPFALSERLMTAHSEGIDPELYYKNYWSTIANANPDDVRETAKRYLNPDEMRVLIAGNKK